MSATNRQSFPSAEADGSLPRRDLEVGPAVAAGDREAAAPHDAVEIEIDARIVADGLGIAPEQVELARRAGTITTLCERGTGEDAGLVRATFYLGKRRLRLLVDAQGRVLQQHPGPDQPNT